MNYDKTYRKMFAKLSALLICRAVNLHGQELENLAEMLVLYFTRKHEWGFYKADGMVPCFQCKPNFERLP